MDGYYMDRDPSYLAHYGVLGMKWGVRKDGKPQGFQYGKAAGRKIKKTASKVSDKVATRVTRLDKSERRQVRQVKRERARTRARRSLLTDKELNDNIARLQKEQQLNNLTQSEVMPGRKAADNTMRTVGTRIAIGAGTALGSAAVLYLASRATGGGDSILFNQFERKL